MSLLSMLFGRRAAGTSTRNGPPLVIVDGAGLTAPPGRQRNGNGQPSPRDNFLTLKTLSDFASREKVPFIVVLTGRPLREAGDGAEFHGVRVFYADNSQAAHDRICSIAADNARHNDVLVVCSEPAVEKRATEAGASCMRVNTLKKTLEDKDRTQQPQRRKRTPDQQQRQPAQQATNNDDTEDETDEDQPEQPSTNDDKDKPDNGVLSLIDPI